MMPGKALSQQEFNFWRYGDTEFKQQMLAHIASQTQLNLDVERRLSTLAAKQDECEETMGRRTTWLSSVISAVIGAVAGAFAGRWV